MRILTHVRPLNASENATQVSSYSVSKSDRIRVWNLIYMALDHIYKKGVLHGDPHSGNIMVSSVDDTFSSDSIDEYDSLASVKIIDFGTSRFWDESNKFLEREQSILLELAMLLFESENISEIIDINSAMNPKCLIDSIQAFTRFTFYAENTEPYARTVVAGELSEIMTEFLVFRVSEIIAPLHGNSYTTPMRLLKRLVARLMDLPMDHQLVGASIETGRWKESYLRARERFINDGSGYFN